MNQMKQEKVKKMKKNNLYVDLNVIQTVPSSNINRDDTGAPKSCIYGGVTRARVSSQSWKRAVRLAFRDMLPDEEVGLRTKKIVGLVAEEIRQLDPSISDNDAQKKATAALTNAGLKIKDPKVGTDALLLISRRQAQALAELAVAGEKDKKAYRAAFVEHPSVDMALFGRMVAGEPSLSYDAACQVAHAVSTHAVETEYDYFTAVDDLSIEDNAGAGHLGVSEFNSSTLYRYATVNCRELFRSLGKRTPEAVKAFAEAFITCMPDGKKNSYANGTLPAGVYIAVRTDRPVSLAPAFEKAAQPSDRGFQAPSMERLVEYAKEVTDYVDEPAVSFVTGAGLADLGEPKKLKTVLDELEAVITDLLPDGGC